MRGRWVVIALVVILVCYCKASNEEVEERGKATINDAQEKAAEGSESWAEWAKEKISEGLGYKDTVGDKITETATGT